MTRQSGDEVLPNVKIVFWAQGPSSSEICSGPRIGIEGSESSLLAPLTCALSVREVSEGGVAILLQLSGTMKRETKDCVLTVRALSYLKTEWGYQTQDPWYHFMPRQTRL